MDGISRLLPPIPTVRVRYICSRVSCLCNIFRATYFLNLVSKFFDEFQTIHICWSSLRWHTLPRRLPNRNWFDSRGLFFINSLYYKEIKSVQYNRWKQQEKPTVVMISVRVHSSSYMLMLSNIWVGVSRRLQFITAEANENINILPQPIGNTSDGFEKMILHRGSPLVRRRLRISSFHAHSQSLLPPYYFSFFFLTTNASSSRHSCACQLSRINHFLAFW